MELFTFTGDWTPHLQLPAFDQFRLTYDRNAPSKASPLRHVKLEIEDQETLDPDPFPEQLAAIRHLILHQYTIADRLLPAIFNRLTAYTADYFEILSKEGRRPLHAPDPLRNMFEITRAEIRLEQREGFAYVALYGPCTWLDGYGVGILLHKDRIIAVEEDRFFDEEIKQDGGFCGSEDYTRKFYSEDAPPHLKRLHLYSPHPKYGTLKPWQQRNNYEYPYRLISNQKNEDFILDVELGFLSIDHEAGSLQSSFHYTTREYEGVTLLEYACRCKNEALIRFILSRKPASLKNCLRHVSHNPEITQLLLDAGAKLQH
jgi:hypothetical protein